MDVLNMTLSIVASVFGIVAAVLAIYIAWEEHKQAKENKLLREAVGQAKECNQLKEAAGHVKSDEP